MENAVSLSGSYVPCVNEIEVVFTKQIKQWQHENNLNITAQHKFTGWKLYSVRILIHTIHTKINKTVMVIFAANWLVQA